jgi:hypothetical protein
MAILIFLILAAVCFGLNAASVNTAVNLDAAGKCFVVLAAIANYWV